jgi:signal transduction histidine kinase
MVGCARGQYVGNEGQPIPSELLPTIFQPFRQAGSKAGRAGSLGLGLFIAQSIVFAHGGRIEVRSTSAGGTTFSVLLPRRISAQV